jgi:hypothetical protein
VPEECAGGGTKTFLITSSQRGICTREKQPAHIIAGLPNMATSNIYIYIYIYIYIIYIYI